MGSWWPGKGQTKPVVGEGGDQRLPGARARRPRWEPSHWASTSWFTQLFQAGSLTASVQWPCDPCYTWGNGGLWVDISSSESHSERWGVRLGGEELWDHLVLCSHFILFYFIFER